MDERYDVVVAGRCATARGVRIVRGEVARLEGGADVRLADGELVARDAVVVAPRFVANAGDLNADLIEEDPARAVAAQRSVAA